MPAPALANTQWLETRMIHLHEHWPVGYVVGHTGVRGSPNGSVPGRWFATMMLTHWTFWPDGADTWDDPIPVPPLDAATLASFNGALLTAGPASTQATLQAAGPTSPIAEPTSPIGTSPPMSQQDSQSQPLAAQPLVQKSQPLKKNPGLEATGFAVTGNAAGRAGPRLNDRAGLDVCGVAGAASVRLGASGR